MKRLEGTASVHELTVISARGPYVLIQVVQFATPERAAELAGRILDLQVPLIDTFVPTEPAPLATLPRDPSGLLARTVPLKSGQGDSMSDADYDPAGAMQLEDNPIQAGPAMQDAGVDTVAISQTTVYQARDADGRATACAGTRRRHRGESGGAARRGGAGPSRQPLCAHRRRGAG